MSNNESGPLSFEEQLQLLAQQYVFYNKEQVHSILRGDPSLASLLLGTYSSILAYFPDAQIFLYACADPEPPGQQGGDSQEEIAAFISTSLEPKVALEHLKAFYQSVWGQALQATQGRIAVGLECV